jgi:hypothetical protein
MFTKNAFVVLGIVIVFCSCGGRGRDERIMAKMLNETLVNTAKNVSASNEYIYYDFNYKIDNPGFKEKAAFLKNKMDTIKFLANKIYTYLDSIKLLKVVDWMSLNKYLNNSKKVFLSIDDDINIEFASKVNRDTSSLDSLINYKNDNYSKDISEQNKILILNKIFCDVKLLENELIKYTNSRISVCGVIFDLYSTLVGQNVTHLKQGEELIINAGVGAFSSKAEPQIRIGQNDIPVIDGRGIYKLKAKGKPGKHSIPVKIEFKDEYDNRKTQIQTVEYTIDQ